MTSIVPLDKMEELISNHIVFIKRPIMPMKELAELIAKEIKLYGSKKKS